MVVGMLGERLASFLELAKKWLIDFGIDPKKLLHGLHQISKDSLLGFLAGTHEIRVKVTSRAEPFLKFIAPGKKLTIKATTGTRTIEQARSTFTHGIYDYSHTDSWLIGKPTEAADAEVYRVEYEGDDTNGFKRLLKLFRIELLELAFTFEQVEDFCIEHESWLKDHYKCNIYHHSGYYFLIKNEADELFVVDVNFGCNGRYINISRMPTDAGAGGYCYKGTCIIVQQQTD